jgi:FixJ family two-component response regulator
MIARNGPAVTTARPTLEVFKRVPLIPMSYATVFVVGDDATSRESLELVSRRAGWRLEAFASASAFLACSRIVAPGCLVLDVSHPDRDGLELQQVITTCGAGMPIIVIATFPDVPMAVQAMKAGAFEFLAKPLSGEVLMSAIQQAIERSGAALVDEAALRALQARYGSLSGREREVMALVVSGNLNKRVAHELGISEITVKAHRGRVMRKMQADSLADLVYMAVRLRVVPRDLESRPGEATAQRGRPEERSASASLTAVA